MNFLNEFVSSSICTHKNTLKGHLESCVFLAVHISAICQADLLDDNLCISGEKRD